MSAVLVHRKVISICQITHVYKYFDSNYMMSEASLDDILKKETREKKKVEDTSSIVLSEDAKNLQSHIQTRYLKKSKVLESTPRVYKARSEMQNVCHRSKPLIFSYLVLETSFYTLRQFKAFKRLASYNQMVSGFITSVQGKIIGNRGVGKSSSFAANE